MRGKWRPGMQGVVSMNVDDIDLRQTRLTILERDRPRAGAYRFSKRLRPGFSDRPGHPGHWPHERGCNRAGRGRTRSAQFRADGDPVSGRQTHAQAARSILKCWAGWYWAGAPPCPCCRPEPPLSICRSCSFIRFPMRPLICMRAPISVLR